VSDPTATVEVTVNGTTYTATNNGDGTWTLADNSIAPALADGTYDVSVTATDAPGNAGTDASVDELTIVTPNSPPVGVDDAFTTDEDLSFTAVLGVDDLLLNDSDPDGDPLTVNATPFSGPTNGTLVLNSDGTFTYTPDADFNGTDSFVYEVSDGNGGIAQATVTITVNPVNDNPNAAGDSYTTNEDQSFTSVLGVDDLILNDSDIDGDLLTVNPTPAAGPTNGILVLNSDGTFTYTPDPDFNGTDAFTYQVSDGNGGTSQAIVTISVNPVNDAPTTTGIADITVNEDAPNTVIDLIGAFADVDDGAGNLTFTVIQNTDPGLFNSATVDGAMGTLTLAYARDAYGSTDITIRATDTSGEWVETTFTVNVNPVNDAPMIGLENFTVDEDVSFTSVLGVDDLLLNDSDVDGDLLTVNTNPVSGPTNGTLVLNSDGTFTYMPNADFNGTDSFTYQVTDGNGGVGQGIVTITINPVNDAPVIGNENMTTDEDTPLTGSVASANNLLANATDADGDALTVDTTPVVGPTNGALVLNSDGSFTYTPDANFNGTDAFTYQVADSNGGISQGIVTIAINPMNDAPVAGSDAMSVNEGSSMLISEASLLANDTDADGDALRVMGFTQPAEGSLTQNSDGSLAYTPAPGFSGVDSFTYTVADAAGAQDSVLVMVTVTPSAEQIDIGDQSDPAPTPAEEPTVDKDGGTSTDQDSEATADKHEDNETSGAGPTGGDTQEESVDPVDVEAPGAPGTPLVEDSRQFGTNLQNQYVDMSGQDIDDVKLQQAETVAPPKFLYDALQVVEMAFDVEIPDFEMASLSELPIWEALDAMKREMSATDGDEQFGGVMVTQISTGMSLMLSAGLMSWILRGGALASALLSTMPMWQGFDPLPILLARKKRTPGKDGHDSQDDEILQTSEVERFFEAAVRSGFDPSVRGPSK
jgi:VCBS repeat-containing protein